MFGDWEWVFYGFDVIDLLLASGRFLVMVVAFLLFMTHLIQLIQGAHKFYRRRSELVLVWIEMIASFLITLSYAYQFFISRLFERLPETTTVILIWALGALFTALLWYRLRRRLSDGNH